MDEAPKEELLTLLTGLLDIGKECAVSGFDFFMFAVRRNHDANGHAEDGPVFYDELNAFLRELPYPVKATFSYDENCTYIERVTYH